MRATSEVWAMSERERASQARREGQAAARAVPTAAVLLGAVEALGWERARRMASARSGRLREEKTWWATET